MWIRAKDWAGRDLTGVWEATLKLDGVRALSNGRTVLSRNGKPLQGLDHLAHTFTDAEIYCGSFKQTIHVVRSLAARPVRHSEVYSLDPLDERLHLGVLQAPTAAEVHALLKAIVGQGHEGLVLRQGSLWLKCKPVRTYDVPVLGVLPGTGKFTGMMGALVTPMGKVGTGFTDEERKQVWEIGSTIEVACRQLTEAGKFHHPRFMRRRFDK